MPGGKRINKKKYEEKFTDEEQNPKQNSNTEKRYGNTKLMPLTIAVMISKITISGTDHYFP